VRQFPAANTKKVHSVYAFSTQSVATVAVETEQRSVDKMNNSKLGRVLLFVAIGVIGMGLGLGLSWLVTNNVPAPWCALCDEQSWEMPCEEFDDEDAPSAYSRFGGHPFMHHRTWYGHRMYVPWAWGFRGGGLLTVGLIVLVIALLARGRPSRRPLAPPDEGE
jgi:hypothetical protein